VPVLTNSCLWNVKTNLLTLVVLTAPAPAGSVGLPSSSGWMDRELFVVRYMKHFMCFTQPSETDSLLVILDGHQSHKSLELIELARRNHVTLVTIPPHTSQGFPYGRNIYVPYMNMTNKYMSYMFSYMSNLYEYLRTVCYIWGHICRLQNHSISHLAKHQLRTTGAILPMVSNTRNYSVHYQIQVQTVI